MVGSSTLGARDRRALVSALKTRVQSVRKGVFHGIQPLCEAYLFKNRSSFGLKFPLSL